MWLRALLSPLLLRLKRGEGGMIATNASLAWAYQKPILPTLVSGAIVLWLAYLVNDLWDAEIDQQNPRKDHAIARHFAGHARNWYLTCAGLSVAGVAISPTPLPAALFLIANFLYSWRIKKIPGLDVPFVCLWGAAFTAMISEQPADWLLFGSMAGLAHIFQIYTDREADTAAGFRTSANTAWGIGLMVFMLLLTELAVVQAPGAGAGKFLLLGLAALPSLSYFAPLVPARRWLLAKALFVPVWIGYVLAITTA